MPEKTELEQFEENEAKSENDSAYSLKKDKIQVNQSDSESSNYEPNKNRNLRVIKPIPISKLKPQQIKNIVQSKVLLMNIPELNSIPEEFVPDVKS